MFIQITICTLEFLGNPGNSLVFLASYGKGRPVSLYSAGGPLSRYNCLSYYHIGINIPMNVP